MEITKQNLWMKAKYLYHGDEDKALNYLVTEDYDKIMDSLAIETDWDTIEDLIQQIWDDHIQK